MSDQKKQRVHTLFVALGERQSNLFDDVRENGEEAAFKYFPELDGSYRPYIAEKVTTTLAMMDEFAKSLLEEEPDELDVLRQKVRDCQRIVYVGLALSTLSLTLTIFNLLQ